MANPERARLLVAILLAPALGIASLVAPVFLLRLPPEQAPVFPLVAAGVEGMSWLTVVLLFGSGLALGLVGRGTWVASLFVTICFPAFALIEMAVDPHSHTMLPFEFAVYAVLAAIALAGGVAGLIGRRRLLRRAV